MDILFTTTHNLANVLFINVKYTWEVLLVKITVEEVSVGTGNLKRKNAQKHLTKGNRQLEIRNRKAPVPDFQLVSNCPGIFDAATYVFTFQWLLFFHCIKTFVFCIPHGLPESRLLSSIASSTDYN